MFALVGPEQGQDIVHVDGDSVGAEDDAGAAVTQNAADEGVVFVEGMMPRNVLQSFDDLFRRKIRKFLYFETVALPQPSMGKIDRGGKWVCEKEGVHHSI